MTANV